MNSMNQLLIALTVFLLVHLSGALTHLSMRLLTASISLTLLARGARH